MPVTRRRSSSTAGFSPIRETAGSSSADGEPKLDTEPKFRKPVEVFQIQALAPAPSQSTYQLVIKDNDEVELRDWPKRRYSEKWTRNSLMNPSTVKVSHNDYLKGALEERVRGIFGPQVYDQTTSLIDKIKREKSKLNSASEKGQRSQAV